MLSCSHNRLSGHMGPQAAFLASWLLVCLGPRAEGSGETEVRIASYNIKFLKADVADTNNYGDRLTKLREVVRLLEADIIALQEIDDRAALETVFSPDEWLLVIDEESNDDQDVALAVRRPWRLPDFSSSLDPDDDDFLFPNQQDNDGFPNRRDVLSVRVQAPNEPIEFYVMVVHAKSRYEGRAASDARRVSGARKLVGKLQEIPDDTRFVVLGDFNDNPDDQSLNILETGDPNAVGGPEEIVGPFLANLMEPLCAADHVSHGLKTDAIAGGRVNTVDPGSRARNNDARGTNVNTGDILFDQILIPAWMIDCYVPNSAKVFDQEVAVKGNERARASDHVPVYADFVFIANVPPEPEVPGVKIAGLLPNPIGADDNNEKVVIKNSMTQAVNLAGWRLKDRQNNTYPLSGTIPPSSSLTLTLQRSAMLNNNGDEVSLVDPQGNESPKVSYTAAQATSGSTIWFN